MPKKTETLPLQETSVSDALALAYAAFEKLDWTPKFAGDKVIVAYTKISWGKPQETVSVEAADDALSITSALSDEATLDVLNKNKKNIAKFTNAFQAVRSTASPEQLTNWSKEVEALYTETVKQLEQDAKDFAEVDKVMNISSGSKLVTYVLMVLNAAVFLLMAVSGVNLFEPDNLDLLNWGASFKPYTADGEWWRLLTCTFVHIGIIHLLFNMYALYVVGIYLEPMLGKAKYIFTYLLTGVLSSLASLGWHGDEAISAGASGAIFGLYGVFLALLFTNLIPKAARQPLLQSIGIFVGYNLLFGLKGGVDNAAHLGGLFSGLILGFIFYPLLKRRIQAVAIAVESEALPQATQ